MHRQIESFFLRPFSEDASIFLYFRNRNPPFFFSWIFFFLFPVFPFPLQQASDG